jgi:hypothetical protein
MLADAELRGMKIRTCSFNKVVFKLLHCAYGAVALPNVQNMSKLLLSNLNWFLLMILQSRCMYFINGITGTVVKCYERPQKL